MVTKRIAVMMGTIRPGVFQTSTSQLMTSSTTAHPLARVLTARSRSQLRNGGPNQR